MARPPRAVSAALLLGLLAAPGAGGADGPGGPRAEIESFARALEDAVRRVSPAITARPGAGAQGYRLGGYGAVFVLSPRLLAVGPRPGGSALRRPSGPALAAAIAALEDALKNTDSPLMRAQIAQHLALLRRGRGAAEAAGAAPERAATEELSLREVEAEAQALERQADLARQAAAQALEEVDRQVRSQRAAAGAGTTPPEGAPAEPARLLPGGPPPWTFWFESAPAERPRTPEALVEDVRTAVAGTIEARGVTLRSLAPEEFLTVAVDFLAPGGFGVPDRAVRTLIVRVRKRALDERGAGRLAPEEFRQRLETVEY